MSSHATGMVSARWLIQAQRSFDGWVDQPICDQAVLVEAGRITALGSEALAQAQGAKRVSTPWLVPGFIDLQVNGANGVLFNHDPDVTHLHRMMQGVRTGGVAYALPTFITAEQAEYVQAMQACEAAQEAVPGVLGVHLEGPFLSEAKPGIHAQHAIRPLTAQDLERLTQPASIKRAITLAPERVDPMHIAALVRAGWRVWAGHSEATWDQMQAARRAGLSGCTHVFNAMPALSARAPGVAGAVLADDQMSAGLIADGVHVHPAMLTLAWRTLGDKRLFLVSDGMPTLGSRITQFVLDGQTIQRQGNSLTNAQGTLAGAHLPMDQAVRNMVNLAGVHLAAAFRMASTTPARVLGLGGELGHIACGYRAGLTLLGEDLCAQAVMVDGTLFSVSDDPTLG